MIAKKGVIFTVISIVLSAIIIAAFFFSTSTPPDKSLSSTKIRILTINNYIDMLDSIIPGQIGASSRSAIYNMSYIILDKKQFFSNSFESELSSCLTTGMVSNPTIPANSIDCGTDLSYVFSELDETAKNKMNINATTTITGIEVTQDSPWNIIVSVNVSLMIIDSYAQWEVNKTYEGSASILGLPDPTYQVNVNPIFNSDDIFVNNFSTTESWNGWIRYPSTLNLLALEHKYFYYDKAPNFLSRMNGALTNVDGTSGIASLVITENRPFSNDVANLDYDYWSWNNCHQTPNAMFDFYTDTSGQERAKLNISEPPELSINGTIVPLDLTTWTNMSDSDYYQTPIGC